MALHVPNHITEQLRIFLRENGIDSSRMVIDIDSSMIAERNEHIGPAKEDLELAQQISRDMSLMEERITKIYLFGSKAKGISHAKSDFDFYVEYLGNGIEEDEYDILYASLVTIALKYIPDAKFDIVLGTIGQYDGQTFMNSIEREGIQLYGCEAYGVTLAKYNTLGRYPDDNRHFSNRDHASAERALTHIRNEMIRISLDQRVEFLGYDYIDYNSSRNDTRL